MANKLLAEALAIMDADGFKPSPNSGWWAHLERAARTHVYKALLERHSNEAVTRHVQAVALVLTNHIAVVAQQRRAEMQQEG